MNTRSMLATVTILVGVVGFSGCATVPARVQSEFDPAVDFTVFKTFAVARLDTRSVLGAPGEILRLGPAMRDAAREAMSAKGFVEVDEPAKTDLVVRIHSKQVPKSEVTDWGFEPNYGSYRWYRRHPYAIYGSRHVTVENYTEGTLIVEAHNVQMRDVVWVGWVTGRTEERRENVLQAATDALRRILEEFPIRGSKPTP